MSSRLLAFVKLGRPKFLLGGFVLYGIGASWAWRRSGVFDARAFGWGLATVIATQLMTHYANDYYDREADAANLTPTRWSGGSRVLVNGTLAPGVALTAALVFASLAVAFGTRTVMLGTRSAIPIGLAMVALAWAYSAPPFRFVARGLGELTTALVVTVLVPCWAARLQGEASLGSLLPLLVPLAILQVAMLLAINCPDAAGDAVTGKRTLVVLLGARRAARLCQALLVGVIAFAFVSPALLARAGAPRVLAVTPVLALPLGVWQWLSWKRIGRGQTIAWEGLAFRAVAMLFSAALATLVALCLLPW